MTARTMEKFPLSKPRAEGPGKRNKVAGSILKVGMWGGRIYLREEDLWEHGLPAMNDNAVRLLNLGAPIAGKPCSHR
ncbi:hypothetical protein B0E42_19925 [Pseudomonas sp. A25(2017)]|uniref:Uncharacterized protein n=1 Tax=Pseudomonas ogarae (strain DSM 112162 / CECT 30235 / F113) TaxID=1114970 RepID=A0ABN5GDK6_PSEO1|nr:hypothetical protein C1C98_26095 [Pseudomonas ogarae]OOG83337.1 hypothetical protein B0E42_19925 [Pseudomonas sp. A25(2017)]